MAAQRTRMATYGWIERDGLVLLSKIGPGYSGAGRWTLPGGGIDWGEHPEHSLHREVYEETGLRGRITDFLGIDSITFEPSEHNGYTSLHAIRFIFRVTARGTPLVTETDGSTIDAAWLPLDNVDDLPIVDLVRSARKMAESGYVFRDGPAPV